MHLRLPILAFTILASAVAYPLHAVPFQNLDFEQAVIVQAPLDPVTFPVYADAALPHWTAKYNTTPSTTIWALPAELDTTAIAMVDTQPYMVGSNPFPFTPKLPLQGNFSVELSSFADPPPSDSLPITSSISQTGDIPSDANSILFYVRPVNGEPNVFIDGNIIQIFPLSTSAGITLWGGDISTFAGTTRTLTFAAIGTPGSFPSDENVYDLDSISFSSTPVVPEPASAALLLLALPLLTRRRR